MSPGVSPSVSNFAFEVANFLLLAGALAWVLFRPVRRALDRERERHRQDTEEQARLRAEAEKLTAEARAARDAAAVEATARRRETVEAAEREAAKILEDARKARADARRVFDHELAAARAADASALAETVGQIAARAVLELLLHLDGPSLDDALVNAACRELAAMPAASRSRPIVESARPLGDDARRRLSAALGTDADLAVRITGELGAGVRVTASGGQVDASAAALARQAARAVTAANPSEPVPTDAAATNEAAHA